MLFCWVNETESGNDFQVWNRIRSEARVRLGHHYPSLQSQYPGLNARVRRPLAAENGAAILRIWRVD